jgi:predicted nucleic acid-binding protein
MVILDTSILIDHFRQLTGVSKFAQFLESYPHQEPAISMVTIQELYEGQSTKDASKEEVLLLTLAGIKVLPYSFDIAKSAGMISRDLGRPLALADSAIAATAITHHCPLFTLNLKDFQPIPNLKLFRP